MTSFMDFMLSPLLAASSPEAQLAHASVPVLALHEHDA